MTPLALLRFPTHQRTSGLPLATTRTSASRSKDRAPTLRPSIGLMKCALEATSFARLVLILRHQMRKREELHPDPLLMGRNTVEGRSSNLGNAEQSETAFMPSWKHSAIPHRD